MPVILPGMDLPPYLRLVGQAVHLEVRVQPRASREEIGGVLDNALKVRVTAPPVDDAANQALLRLLAQTLDCPRSALHLVRGRTARRKTIEIRGRSADEIARRLAAPS